MKVAKCHADRPHYVGGMCAPCYQRQYRKTWTPKTRAKCHPDRAHKCRGMCSACYQRYKASPEFTPRGRATTVITCGHPNGKHVGHGLCAACYTRASRDKDREADRARRKDYQLRATYGIDLQEFHARYEGQGHACALCRKPVPVERHRHVDHCHETGRVRGILCFDCNKGLGMLGDTPASIRRALDYVEGKAGVFIPLEAAA